MTSANEVLILGRRNDDTYCEMTALVFQGRANYFLGHKKAAKTAFDQALALERKRGSGSHYLFSSRGVYHADYLRRIGKTVLARKVAQNNLNICKKSNWLQDISRNHRILGDLFVKDEKYRYAQHHYNEALKIARSISFLPALIETLISRGRCMIQLAQYDAAQSDLDEALDYAIKGNYRVYEVDVNIAISWIYHFTGDSLSALERANYALLLSIEMGYYWGQIDADEVISLINQ